MRDGGARTVQQDHRLEQSLTLYKGRRLDGRGETCESDI